MKRFSLAALAATILFVSCSEDFEIAAPYEDITAVYGILSMDDTAHYIRIQKAFLDENKSAVSMATEPDSSFYNNLDVRVDEIDVNTKQVSKSYPLTRVDLNNEGYPKEPGAFFTSPNYAYKFKADFNPYYLYRLYINNSATGAVDSADVFVVNNDTARKQNSFFINDFNNASYQLDFAKTASQNDAFRLLVSVPVNGKIFESYFRFNYIDSNTVTNQFTQKSFTWQFDEYILEPGKSNFQFEVPNTAIYSILRDNMGIAPANNVRRITGVDIIVSVGDNILYTYEQITLNSGGITGDQIKPTYTNVRGSNRAVGIVGSRARREKKNIPISAGTLLALNANPLTAPVRIIQ